MTFWHYERVETNQTHATHKRHTLYQNVLYLQGNSVQHFLFHCQNDEKVALPEKKKQQNRW